MACRRRGGSTRTARGFAAEGSPSKVRRAFVYHGAADASVEWSWGTGGSRVLGERPAPHRSGGTDRQGDPGRWSSACSTSSRAPRRWRRAPRCPRRRRGHRSPRGRRHRGEVHPQRPLRPSTGCLERGDDRRARALRDGRRRRCGPGQVRVRHLRHAGSGPWARIPPGRFRRDRCDRSDDGPRRLHGERPDGATCPPAERHDDLVAAARARPPVSPGHRGQRLDLLAEADAGGRRWRRRRVRPDHQPDHGP